MTELSEQDQHNAAESAISRKDREQLPHDADMERRIAAAVERGYRHAYEIPDPIPLAPPLGYKRAPTIAEQLQLMVRGEMLRREAEAAGAESFEEAEDFDVEDLEPYSPYELLELDPVDQLRAMRDQEAALRRQADERDLADRERLDAFYRSRGVTPPAPAQKPVAEPPKPKEPPSEGDAGN